MAFNASIFAGMGEAAREKQTQDREQRTTLLNNLSNVYTLLADSPSWASDSQQQVLLRAQMEIASADPGDRKSSSNVIKKLSNLWKAGALPESSPQTLPGMEQQPPRAAGDMPRGGIPSTYWLKYPPVPPGGWEQDTGPEVAEVIPEPAPPWMGPQPHPIVPPPSITLPSYPVGEDSISLAYLDSEGAVPIPTPIAPIDPKRPMNRQQRLALEEENRRIALEARREEAAWESEAAVQAAMDMLPVEIARKAALVQFDAPASAPAAIQLYDLWAQQQPPNTDISYTAYLEATDRPSQSDAARYAELYGLIQRGEATPEQVQEYEGLMERATLVSNTRYDLQNPGLPQDTAERIARLVLLDAANWGDLVGSDRRAQQQVRDIIARSDQIPNRLTAATQQLGEAAQMLLPKFDSVLAQLEDPAYREQLGLVMSRWQDFLLGTLGTGVSEEFADLSTTVSMLNTGTMRAHVGARGSEGMLAYFKNLMNPPQMDANTLRTSLRAVRNFLSTYADRLELVRPVPANQRTPYSLPLPDSPGQVPSNDVLDAYSYVYITPEGGTDYERVQKALKDAGWLVETD